MRSHRHRQLTCTGKSTSSWHGALIMQYMQAIKSLDGLLMDTVTLTKPANFSNSPTAQKTLITNYMTVANQTSESESAAYTTNTIVEDVEDVLFANSSGLSALLNNLFVAVS